MTVANDLHAFGQASENLGWLDQDSLESEVAILLPKDTWSSYDGHSRLNANGSPLQLCISVENSKIRGRLLVDPCHLLNGEARFHGAWDVAFSLCDQRASSLKSALQASFKLMLNHCSPEDFVNGPLWLATIPNSKGMAIYFDSKPLKGQAAAVIKQWLDSIAPQASGYFDSLLSSDSGVQLASFGIEGRTMADARAKIYFRLQPGTTLTSLRFKELYSNPMVNWLTSVIPEGEISPSGLVLSVSSPLIPGAEVEGDGKIDICGHCAKHSLQKWDYIFSKTSSAAGMPTFADKFDIDQVDIAFAGLGVNADMKSRVNVYLQAVR